MFGVFLLTARCLGWFFLTEYKSDREKGDKKGGEKTQQFAFKLFVGKIKSVR